MATVGEANESLLSRVVAVDVIQWPAVVWVAICLVCGVVFGSLVPAQPAICLTVLFVWLLTAATLLRFHTSLATVSVYVFIVLLGACRWQMTQFSYDHNTIQTLAGFSQTARLTAQIVSIPVVSVRPAGKFAPRLYGTSQRTQFLIDVKAVETPDGSRPVSGRCQAYVDGDATSSISAGDEIRLIANLSWPDPPGNPGEFDYRTYLIRKRIAATAFVHHPQAISVVKPAASLSIGAAATWLRRTARNAIVSSVDGETEAVALALLLGNRHQLPSATEEAFVASGTMHLLAISGLHVGILCVFLLRFFNLLLLRRTTALFATGLICVLYAISTDLRPSVLRATVFFWVYVVGQVTGRNQQPSTLISLTVLLLVGASPELVFDTGAWLSFLSVAALGWVASWKAAVELQDDTPLDALSVFDLIRDWVVAASKKLLAGYQQMLCILAVTTPLVAATFHVVSPVGLIVNVVLIPFTALILWFGFCTLLIGLISPGFAHLPGSVLSFLLKALQWVVESTASINAGHLYVSDFPGWFLPAYYLLLILILVIRLSRVRRTLCCGLMCCIVAGFAWSELSDSSSGLRCSVLSVGHGSAAVLETSGGRVILIDAGAMNRGARSANVICNFLWSRGYRKIDSILISHADMDHYNAVPEIIRRIPVGELVTSSEVVQSESPFVQSVLEYANQLEVPVRILRHEDFTNVDGVKIEILQAELDPQSETPDDNERSLVVLVEFGESRILLPGDLEGPMADSLIQHIGPVDVLVSPHHGSLAANPESLATATQPRSVIVSARNSGNRPALEAVYATSQDVWFTSDAGCVTIEFHRDSPATVVPYSVFR